MSPDEDSSNNVHFFMSIQSDCPLHNCCLTAQLCSCKPSHPLLCIAYLLSLIRSVFFFCLAFSSEFFNSASRRRQSELDSRLSLSAAEWQSDAQQNRQQLIQRRQSENAARQTIRGPFVTFEQELNKLRTVRQVFFIVFERFAHCLSC